MRRPGVAWALVLIDRDGDVGGQLTISEEFGERSPAEIDPGPCSGRRESSVLMVGDVVVLVALFTVRLGSERHEPMCTASRRVCVQQAVTEAASEWGDSLFRPSTACTVKE